MAGITKGHDQPDNGVVMLTFGKREYAYMAIHMAMSIKTFNEDIRIHIIDDGNLDQVPLSYHKVYDSRSSIKEEDLKPNGIMDPGYAKCMIYNYLPYQNNLVLDVDGLCLKDLSPLFDIDKDYATIICGTGGIDDKINYSHWAPNKAIWDYFELGYDKTYSTIQSSMQFIRKSENTRVLYEMIKDKFFFPKEKLSNGWGHSIPDELVISGCAAKLEMDIDIGSEPIFFGWKNSDLSLSEISDKYYITSLYGNGKGNPLVKQRYRDWYDRLMVRKHTKHHGLSYLGRTFQLMRGKYVNPH